MTIALKMLGLTMVDAVVLATTPSIALLVIYTQNGETWAELYLRGEVDGEIERKAIELSRHEVARRGHSLARLAIFRATLMSSV
jgi:hypothetical protein